MLFFVYFLFVYFYCFTRLSADSKKHQTFFIRLTFVQWAFCSSTHKHTHSYSGAVPWELAEQRQKLENITDDRMLQALKPLQPIYMHNQADFGLLGITRCSVGTRNTILPTPGLLSPTL